MHRKSDPAGRPLMSISEFHCGLVIDTVIILSLVQEMELIDAFVIHVFSNDIFWKHTVAHDRLVIDDVIILILVEYGIKRCICNTCVCYRYTFKECRITWQIGNAVIILAMELLDALITHVFAIDTFWKHAEAHDRLVLDAVITLTLVADMELMHF